MPDKTASEKYRERLEQASKKQESKYARLKASKKAGGLTWDDVNETTLHTAVASVTADGAALLLSITSDGGALVIRVIEDNGGDVFHPSSANDAEDTLRDIAATANKP